MKINILLFCLVFFVNACGVVRKSSLQVSQKDSVVYKEIIQIDTIRIPQDRVRVVVDNSKLQLKQDEVDRLNHEFLKLKQATGSRANVQIRVVRDSVFIEGTCDSAEILSLRKTIKEYKSRESEKVEKEKVKRNTMLPIVIMIIIIGLTLLVVLKWLRIL